MNARDIVTTRIAEQARRFPDWLNVPLDTSGLDARDAALALAIDHAVLRHWLALTSVIESQLSRPWAEVEFKLQAALLVGAAQLLLLERLPDHAVINEAVEWAKRKVRPKAGGMVNAVLRKVARLRKELLARQHATTYERDEFPLNDGRVWRLNEAIFDEQPIRRLAQQTSHAESLIVNWTSIFGAENTFTLAQHSLLHAPITIHNISETLTLTQEDKVTSPTGLLEPHDEPKFFVFHGKHESLLQVLHANPSAIVQDPASAAPVKATAAVQPPPRTIVDACAGKGTKTRQLAMLHPAARIIATDIDDARFAILREQFANHPRVQVIPYDQLREHYGQADLLLLDVPCSNTGVLARRVEAKYRYSRDSQETVVNLQRQIIANSLGLLAESGRLVYSTCSIEPVENQQQAQWVCKWHPMRVVHEQQRLPTGVPGDPPTTYSDGGYYAVLERLSKA